MSTMSTAAERVPASSWGLLLFLTALNILNFVDRMLIASLAIWSSMTALSGWARSFIQLAIPRIFVGIGEATLTPAAISMLGDAFPPQRLGLAIGVYYAGIPLGLAIALISSSFIAPRFGWRVSFFALGI